MSEVATLAKEITSKVDGLVTKITAVEKKLNEPDWGKGRTPATPIDHKEAGKYGFKSFGNFLEQVKASERNHEVKKSLEEQVDKGWNVTKSFGGMVTKASQGLNESVDSEGGFLVPPTFSQSIFERVYENDLLSRTDKYTVTGKEMIFPAIDETSRANGSRFGGVLAYWRDEANTVTATKPKFRNFKLSLKSLMALGYVTEELLADSAVTMDSYLTKQFAGEIEFKVGDAVINGDGSGMPRGILNHPATVQVAKETGQAAATITPQNIWKMWQRMWAPSRKNAVWLYNQDCEHQFYGMKLDIGTGGAPVYMPPGGLSESPYATLMGRPMIPIEFAQTLGTAGDIMLADFSQYATITKGAPDTQMSMHLRFDYAEMAYRTIFRIDGDCWWSAALTPFKGSNTLSPFVKLATRA